MKYCPKCSKVFEDDVTVCKNCNKPLINTISQSDPVCIISADGFERERIIAALKDNGVPCTEKMGRKERSADAVTGKMAAKVEILVPYAAIDKAKDILIGIGAIKVEGEEILNENTDSEKNYCNNEEYLHKDKKELCEKNIEEISSKKRIAIRIISAILLIAVACAVIWGTDYIISFVQNLFGWTNTTNIV